MYLREKRIRVIKIINYILAFFTIVNLIASVSWELYLVYRYWGDFDTVVHAKATPDFIFWVIAGPLILFCVFKTASYIEDAVFYSNYFEGDLDGTVDYHELAEVNGVRAGKVRFELRWFIYVFMKNYIFKDGKAILESKTVTCTCRNCAGVLEKKLFFTGECPYCGSSDLNAKVVTDGRFYSISSEVKGTPKKYDYYTVKGLYGKKIFFAILMGISLFIILISAFIAGENIENYNNMDYLRSVILDPDDHRYSYEQIRYDIVDNVIFCVFIVLGLIPVFISRVKRIGYLTIADINAKYFANVKTPFVKASSLPSYRNVSDKRKLRLMRKAIQKGYLKHCSLEKHGGILQAALGKTITKDKCPSCGASITGAAYKDYVCKYCGKKIMDVVVKKG